MSVEGFVHFGYHHGQVMRRPGGVYGEIQLFDIADPNYVGAMYGDGSRQAHPFAWHHGVERAIAQHVRVQPSLKKKPALKKKYEHVMDPHNVDEQVEAGLAQKAALHAELSQKPTLQKKLPPPKKMTQEERDAAADRNHAAIQGLGAPEAEMKAARPFLKPRLKRHG